MKRRNIIDNQNSIYKKIQTIIIKNPLSSSFFHPHNPEQAITDIDKPQFVSF
jgi:hypothetical protein